MATGTSQLKGGLQFDKDYWLVSFVNTQAIQDDCDGRGHAVVLIEGLDESGKLFAVSFDAIRNNAYFMNGFQKRCGNEQGTLELREFNGYGKKAWSTFEYRAKTVSADKTRAMIASIRKEITANKQAIADGSIKNDPRFAYQNAGSERSALLGGNGGDNCVTKAEKWLKQVDADFFVKAVDSVKASPRVHVHASKVQLIKRSLLTALGLGFLAPKGN